MDDKRAFLIGGGGTLGEYAALELLKAGWTVDVLAPEELTSQNRRLRYFRGRADDATLRELFVANRYAVIVDYLHYRDSEAWKPRADFLLANTDQLVFLSSCRVYRYYEELPGARFVWVPAADYVKYATADEYLKAKGLA